MHYLLALLFGLCVPLSLAPFNFWPLMFVGVAGFFWLSFQATNSKHAALLGWLYGVGYFTLGVSWIYGSMQTVETPVWLSIILTGGFCFLMALFHTFQLWFFHRFLKHLTFALLLVSPLWWVVNEWIREWFLTGMPWLFAGYAFTDISVGQLAAVVGIYGLSFLLAIASAWVLKSLLSWLKNRQLANLKYAALAMGCFALLSLIGVVKPASSWTAPLRTINTAAVQSNVNQRTKWSAAQQRPTLDFYGQSIVGMKDVDLIVWPEAAMTRRPDQIPYFLKQVQDLGESRDQAIITGILMLHDGRFYNSMLGYGTASGEYNKQHLVPFGEYVPLENWLRGLIAFFDLPMLTMYPAAQEQTPIPFSLESQPYFAAPVICYEAAYPDLVRKLAKDADIIAIVSNDAWFGDSLGPHQHLQISRMRAIENGRAIVRATQNGVSALIDADGKVLSQSKQFEPAELIGDLTLRSGKTPFQLLPASTFPLGCLLLIVAIGLWSRRSNIDSAITE